MTELSGKPLETYFEVVISRLTKSGAERIVKEMTEQEGRKGVEVREVAK